MGYGRIHEHAGYPINHRFRMVGSSLFELYVPAPSWLVPCMQFDEEQKRADRKWEATAIHTYAVWYWLGYFKGLWSAVHVCCVSTRLEIGDFIGRRRERASSKPKAWCCSTIHDAHGRHDQQCHDAVFRVYRREPWKSSIANACHQYAHFFFGFIFFFKRI